MELNQMRYTATKFVTLENLTETNAPKIGQWVKNEFGQRGQFLGVTLTGTVVIRWQRYAKFERDDARANKPLRAFAKIYGSK